MLGDLSKQYESGNLGAGAVSSGWGDAGGISYGAYQFASNAGVPADFVAWLIRQGYQHGHTLSRAGAPGSPSFSQTWAYVAENDYDGFLTMQHEYVKQQYYDPAVQYLRQAGFNAEKHSVAMQDVIWSRAVQYGPGLIVEMFEAAAQALGHPNLSYVDDDVFDGDLIRAIYIDVCMTPEWTNGSLALRQGLYARFEAECSDALAILDGEVA